MRIDLYLRAKELRRNATKAERVLWKYLANKKLGNYKFRSQAVIENMYIADFYCFSKKLIIEIDGSIHNLKAVKERDANRTLVLNENNYTVVRFTNEEVLTNIKIVLIKILRTLEEVN